MPMLPTFRSSSLPTSEFKLLSMYQITENEKIHPTIITNTN